MEYAPTLQVNTNEIRGGTLQDRHANMAAGFGPENPPAGDMYLGVRYADAEDAAAKVLVKKPVAAYVEKVYPDGDFAGLGI